VPKNIYWGYPEKEAIVRWITNDVVIINGKVLNIFKDIYDFRRQKNNSFSDKKN
jgi:hypothetical protein